MADQGHISIFRSKAQAFEFLGRRIGFGWSRSHEVRTIWRRSNDGSTHSTAEDDEHR